MMVQCSYEYSKLFKPTHTICSYFSILHQVRQHDHSRTLSVTNNLHMFLVILLLTDSGPVNRVAVINWSMLACMVEVSAFNIYWSMKFIDDQHD